MVSGDVESFIRLIYTAMSRGWKSIKHELAAEIMSSSTSSSTLFHESRYCDKLFFGIQLLNEPTVLSRNIDISAYYERALKFSKETGKRSMDWLATVSMWIDRDIQKKTEQVLTPEKMQKNCIGIGTQIIRQIANQSKEAEFVELLKKLSGSFSAHVLSIFIEDESQFTFIEDRIHEVQQVCWRLDKSMRVEFHAPIAAKNA